MLSKNPEQVIRAETIVDASQDEVWDAWTTEKGVKSFLAPECNIDVRVDGPYEIFFDPEAEHGQRGGEGVRILALETRKMLSITWNAPPHLSEVRKQWTHVTVRLEETREGHTKVTLTHDGWGEGKEWDEAFAYFTRAWTEVVLPRLKHRFSVGPIDWNNPSKLS
ncbi:MAG: SRPBCC domain-containing protein [Candidatus Bathyarchaeia archaeon]|jgi:uncharacterized protein YndB with AHSA1/START domain